MNKHSDSIQSDSKLKVIKTRWNACVTLVIANKVKANKKGQNQRLTNKCEWIWNDISLRYHLKFVSCHNQKDAQPKRCTSKTSYYKKCHNQKDEHHLATFNKSEANYVNQTKVIRYSVIAKVRGSRKQSDSKPCDYTRRSKPCDYTHRSKPCDYTRRSKPCDYTRRSKQKRYIHCSFNKSQNQCFSPFFCNT